MTRRVKFALLGALTFFLGASLPALMIWNPAGWAWADHIVGRTSPESAPGAEPAMEGSQPERRVLYWRAPMDPNFVSDKPGKSPMGMDLIPVYADRTPDSGGQTPESGGSLVRVDPSFVQNFAVRTAVVERGNIPIEIRTVGILGHNEENVVSVNTKYDGWIEKAYFNNVGQAVKKGDVLFEIYSPQLVTTQQEFLAALDYVSRLEKSGFPDAVDRARSLLEASRERLRYWDLPETAIERLEQTRQVSRTAPVLAPTTGTIVAKMGDSLEGMRLQAGMTVLKFANHAKLWAEIELFEDDVRHVREGTLARIEVRSFPGRRWQGRVAFFDSAVNPQTRTLRAFIEIDNPDMQLRPQMYADVLIRAGAVTGAVLVPQQAVIHSGERAVVIVQREHGAFEPREVEVGPIGGDVQEIRRGLEPGEVIVTSSQFLIDSESNLKAAISQLLGDPGRAPEAQPAPVERHQH